MTQFWRYLLGSRWPYVLARWYLGTRRSYACRALRSMAVEGAGQVATWYRQERPVVWTTAFVPSELIHALGLSPFAVEAVTALTSNLGLAHGFLNAAESAWYSADL